MDMIEMNSRYPRSINWPMASSLSYYRQDSILETHRNRNPPSNNTQCNNVNQHQSNNPRTTKQNLSNLISDWCSSVSPFLYGLLLGVLTGGLILAIIIALWLTSNNNNKASATTASVSNPVLRWKSSGTTVAGLSGSPGSNASQLNKPVDIALDPFNTLYIADYYNNRVQKWILGRSSGTTVAGQANGSLGTTAAYLYYPAGVYADSNGNIYVSDSYNHRVQLWTTGASMGTLVAGTGSPGSSNNELNFPYGILQDTSTKTLYIADFNNHRVMSYTSGASIGSLVIGGNGPGIAETQLSYPVGIFLDSFMNRLFISNFATNNIVSVIWGTRNWTLVAGSITGLAGNSSAMFFFPADVTLDPMGNMYVADAGNHRVQFFLPGQIEGTTIAGNTGVNGGGSNQLNMPYAVQLDSQLNLYVADSNNHRIQKFERY